MSSSSLKRSRNVSFETRNLCTFLLGFLRSIISSLDNDYYLISFFSISFMYWHMYQILYFIFHRHKFLSTPLILSAIHVRSAIGDLCKKPDEDKFLFISHLRCFLFFIPTLSYFLLSVHSIIASWLIRLVLHF